MLLAAVVAREKVINFLLIQLIVGFVKTPVMMETSKSKSVVLLIDGQPFKVNKNELCEHSDYFQAMFSGNFSEQEKHEISIDVVDANSMNIILKFMRIGWIDLTEYSLPTIQDLAISANFLQIPGLIKQIECWFDINLSEANWVDVMSFAENACYKKLEESAAAYGLYQFTTMKPEYIPQVQKLVWYLSHSHLNTDSELKVFKFGFDWIKLKESGADALLLILGCLDINLLRKEDLCEMKTLVAEYVNSLAEKVVDCLSNLATDFELTVTAVRNNKTVLCETFTERVYTEVLSLISDSKSRELKLEPCMVMWKKTENPATVPSHYLYKFSKDVGFTKWLEVADPALWGWNVIAWGPTKIVTLCGKFGRSTGDCWRSIVVYDCLRKEWIDHGIDVPIGRHGGVAVLDDEIYIIGGVGDDSGSAYYSQNVVPIWDKQKTDILEEIYQLIKWVVLDTVIVYNVKERVYRKLKALPETIQSPSVCVHENAVYVCTYKKIYRYDKENDKWITVLETSITPNCLVSYKGYIYCARQCLASLYRFRPDVDTELEFMPFYFKNPLATICNVGDKLLIFGRRSADQGNKLVSVEEYRWDYEEPKVIWSQEHSPFSTKDVCGSCSVIDTLPPLKNEFSPYLKRTLANYEACCPN